MLLLTARMRNVGDGTWRWGRLDQAAPFHVRLVAHLHLATAAIDLDLVGTRTAAKEMIRTKMI